MYMFKKVSRGGQNRFTLNVFLLFSFVCPKLAQENDAFVHPFQCAQKEIDAARFDFLEFGLQNRSTGRKTKSIN